MSDQSVVQYFSKYGEIGSYLIKENSVSSIHTLPEKKKQFILNHKYGFICFKSCQNAMKALSEIPYLKLKDDDYNTQLIKVVQHFVSIGEQVEPKFQYMAACFMLDRFKAKVFDQLSDDQVSKKAFEEFYEVNC